jgi:hypothetical protein
MHRALAASACLTLPACVKCAAAQSLLLLRTAVENWGEFYAGNDFQGWDMSLPVCMWSGITCADDGTILTL